MFAAAALKQRALDLGFDFAGIAPPSATQDLEFLTRWIELGHAGEMHYLKNPRREDVRRVLPSIKSVLCVGLVYNTPYPYSVETDENKDRGWISRYAWGRDYHKVMRGKLERMRAAIEQTAPGVETRVYVDTGPVVERAFARLSGIGWMGKNTCLINEQKGSWFFLGVILTSLELAADFPAPDRCGSCTRCLEACPTGALTEPYVMDASRCIAYFNIELRGPIPEAYRTGIGQNVVGCDICQDVCPWNGRPASVVTSPQHNVDAGIDQSGPASTRRRVATTSLPEFQPLQIPLQRHEDDSASPASQQGMDSFSLFNPTLENLAAMTEADFKRVFAHSPIKRVKYRGWLRNLCVAMGNSGNAKFVPWLESIVLNSDALVREHATWAIRNLNTRAEKFSPTPPSPES